MRRLIDVKIPSGEINMEGFQKSTDREEAMKQLCKPDGEKRLQGVKRGKEGWS